MFLILLPDVKAAQWGKTFAANPTNLSLIPRTHTVGRAHQPYKLFSDLHLCTIVSIGTHIH